MGSFVFFRTMDLGYKRVTEISVEKAPFWQRSSLKWLWPRRQRCFQNTMWLSMMINFSFRACNHLQGFTICYNFSENVYIYFYSYTKQQKFVYKTTNHPWVPVITAWHADGVVGLQIWRLTANIVNKQSWTAEQEWSSSLGVWRGANNLTLLKVIFVQKRFNLEDSDGQGMLPE